MIMDAQDNLEKMLSIKIPIPRVQGACSLLFELGVDDPIEKYMEMKQRLVIEHGSLGDIENDEIYRYNLHKRDNYILREIAKNEGIMPYALVKGWKNG